MPYQTRAKTLFFSCGLILVKVYGIQVSNARLVICNLRTTSEGPGEEKQPAFHVNEENKPRKSSQLALLYRQIMRILGVSESSDSEGQCALIYSPELV